MVIVVVILRIRRRRGARLASVLRRHAGSRDAAAAEARRRASRRSRRRPRKRRRRRQVKALLKTRARAGRCPRSTAMFSSTERGTALTAWIDQSGVKTSLSSVLLSRSALALVVRIRRSLSALRMWSMPVGVAARLRRAVPGAEHQARPPAARVRGAVPRGARPDRARAEGRARVRDRTEDGRRRNARAGRPRVPEDLRRAELRLAAEGCAREPHLPGPAARRPFLRDGGADSARDRRQPVGDPREPRARRARALQDPAPGAGLHRARPADRLRAAGAAGVPVASR